MPAEHPARKRLIESASRLFHLRGYSAVGVQELCELANVRRGSFYYHFPSKEALALAVLEHEEKALADKVFDPAFADDDTPPLERFAAFLRLLHSYQLGRAKRQEGFVGGCPIANLGHELASQSTSVRVAADQILERLSERFKSALSDARAAGDLPGDIDVDRTALRVRMYTQGLQEVAKLRNDASVILDAGIDIHGLCVQTHH